MTEQIVLRSCPFCGSKGDVELVMPTEDTGYSSYVICLTCRARTSDYTFAEEAAIKWNLRTEQCRCWMCEQFVLVREYDRKTHGYCRHNLDIGETEFGRGSWERVDRRDLACEKFEVAQ